MKAEAVLIVLLALVVAVSSSSTPTLNGAGTPSRVSGRELLTDEKDNTPQDDLVAAIRHQDVAKMKALLREGVSGNIPTSNGDLPLTAAILYSNDTVDMVQALLESGRMDVNRRVYHKELRKWSSVPLVHATQQAGHEGDASIVELLLRYGANPDGMTVAEPSPQYVPLIEAVKGKNFAIQEVLMENGAYVRMRDERYRTALHFAYDKDSAELLIYRRDRWPDVDAIDLDSWTPLMMAADRDYLEAVQALVDYRANVTMTKDGKTAADFACEHPDSRTCKYLKPITDKKLAKLEREREEQEARAEEHREWERKRERRERKRERKERKRERNKRIGYIVVAAAAVVVAIGIVVCIVRRKRRAQRTDMETVLLDAH